jgi:PAS domain S-box-containing protein
MEFKAGSAGDSEVRRIIRGLPGAVVFLSSDDFKVKIINEAYRHFLPERFRERDLTGVRLVEFVAGGEKSPVLDILQRVSETKERVEKRELKIRNEDGAEFWMDWSALPIDNGTDKADLLVMITDITERKQSQMLGEALNQVNAFINSTLDYNEIMRRVLKEGSKVLEAESSLINMHEGGHWVARHVHNFPSSIVGQKKTDEESPTSVMVTKEKTAIAIDDAFNDPRVDRKGMKAFGVRSVLVSPIVLRNEVIGIIAFYYHARSVKFSNAQIEFANRLTLSLSQAIDNARNFQDAKSAEERVRQQNALLEGINRIFHESIAKNTNEDLGLVCLSVVEKITQSKFGFIGQMNSRGYLDDDAISDPGWDACKMSAPIGHGRLPTSMRVTGIYGRVITDGKAFFTNDPINLPDSTGMSMGNPSLTSFLGVPLKHAGKVIGMIGLGNKEGGYNDEDLKAAEALAPAIVEALKRRKAEKDLKESEARYRGMFENLHEAVSVFKYVYNDEGEIIDRAYLDVNREALKMIGRHKEDLLGKTISEVFGVKSASIYIPQMKMMKESGSMVSFENHFEPLNRYFFSFFVPLSDETFLVSSLDITEIKRAQKEVQEERDRLSSLINSISDEVWFADTQGNFTLTNPSAVKEFGLDEMRDGVDVETLALGLEIYQPDGIVRPLEDAPPLRALKGEVVKNQEEVVRTPAKGEIRYRQVNASPVRDTAGRIIGSVSVVRDITERKRAEREQETTAEFLRLVNVSTGTKDLIEKATTFFQRESGVEAVGIRIRVGHDYPYYEARGFPNRFIQLENSLCARDEHGCPLLDEHGEPVMECTCGSLIQGIFNPSKPYYTRHGSFWTNSTTELAPTMTEEDLPPRHRNRCVGEGYESIALIPLFVGKERLGLLQLNDHRTGLFSAPQIAQWERLAGYLSVAVSKFRTEEELKDSEAKYRGLFENLQEGVVLRRLVFDDNGEVIDRILVDANPAALRSLGIGSIEEVRGKRQSEMFSPETAALALEDIRRMRTVGGPITEETHYDATGRDYLTTFMPLGHDYVITTSIDITESKQARRELAENYEAARQRAEEVERLMDIIPAAIWVAYDPECQIITGNRAADQFYESDPGENVSAGMASGGVQDTTRRFFRDGVELGPEALPMQEAAATGREVLNSELEVLTPSGNRLTILGSASPLLNSRREVRGCISSFVDITQRKNQERELEETKGRLEAIIGQMPVGIIVTESKTGKILFANEETERIYGLGYSLTDIKGFDEYNKLARHHLDGRQYKIGEYPFVRSLNGEVIRNDLAEIIRSDGSKVYISSSSAPVYDSRGAIVASVALSIDVTAQVQTQRERDRLLTELEEHSRKLQRSNAELQQFAYVASHDLQEPLRMVTAYLSLIEKKYGKQLDGKAREYMDYAVEGGLRAKDLVRDLLEVSRIESQGKPMGITDMNVVMDRVRSNLAIQITEEHAAITQDRLPQVMADDAQMTTLLQNLVSNGIKFHGERDPQVHISCEIQDDSWVFAVGDNGIGIDPQFKDKIFVIFQRLHSRDEYEGTGIGLAIAKKIVERHGGRIWFDSRAGQGTTFFFTIPKGGL